MQLPIAIATIGYEAKREREKESFVQRAPLVSINDGSHRLMDASFGHLASLSCVLCVVSCVVRPSTSQGDVIELSGFPELNAHAAARSPSLDSGRKPWEVFGVQLALQIFQMFRVSSQSNPKLATVRLDGHLCELQIASSIRVSLATGRGYTAPSTGPNCRRPNKGNSFSFSFLFVFVFESPIIDVN